MVFFMLFYADISQYSSFYPLQSYFRVPPFAEVQSGTGLDFRRLTNSLCISETNILQSQKHFIFVIHASNICGSTSRCWMILSPIGKITFY